MLWEEQQENGWNDVEIDGMHGFIFCNRFGNVPNPQSVNRALKRIVADYNASEEVNAKKEHREAVMLPDFSAHHLRHTFCTRLCEQETNLKVIQSIMGHKDIKTTMDIYAEATEEKKQESFERLAATLNVFYEGLNELFCLTAKFFKGQQIDSKCARIMVRHEAW